MSSEAGGQFTVRVLHHMARTGGTLICRCLASMSGVVLLSEIHPLGVKTFDPLRQAHEWYGLLNAQDLASLRTAPMAFEEAIALIVARCAERGLNLILRDWSHLDYTGIPFTQPGYRSRLVEALQARFHLLRFSTVRHPLDQWLSLSQQPIFRSRLGAGNFLRGAARFAQAAQATGFARYEDFTRDSDVSLRTICSALQLEFDPGYRERWTGYTRVTGDVLPGRGGTEIEQLPRRAMDLQEADRFRAHADYSIVVESLGYDD